MMKTCFKCNGTFSIDAFYKHPEMADGHLGKCKDCTRKDSERRRKAKMKDPEWVRMEAERHRAKAKRSNSEDKQIARARRAVRSLGRSKNYHLHHWSYNEAHKLDVINMTPMEHRRAHRFLVFDREHLMYRRSDIMELLDTRERHEAFLSSYVSHQSF